MTSAVPAGPGVEIGRREEVRGTVTHGLAWPVEEAAYVSPVQATIAGGRITAVEASAAAAEPGVLAVVTHEDAPPLASTDDAALAILQSRDVAYRGQIVAGVIADTPEAARHGASLVRLEYEERGAGVELRPGRGDLASPSLLDDRAAIGIAATGTPVPSATQSDFDAALASAEVTVEAAYTTPLVHHGPMEPHSNVAIWANGVLTVYSDVQAVHVARGILAKAFGLDPDMVRVIAPGGGG